jgi:hypothetical protein
MCDDCRVLDDGGPLFPVLLGFGHAVGAYGVWAGFLAVVYLAHLGGIL